MGGKSVRAPLCCFVRSCFFFSCCPPPPYFMEPPLPPAPFGTSRRPQWRARPLRFPHRRRAQCDPAGAARKDGTIVLHTNPGMVGGRIRDAGLGEWLRSGKTFGRRIMLGTGLPAYEFNYLLHGPGEEPEILRLVLPTTHMAPILSDARRMWWTVGGVLVLLWSFGIALDRVFVRHLRLEAQVERRERLALIGQ